MMMKAPSMCLPLGVVYWRSNGSAPTAEQLCGHLQTGVDLRVAVLVRLDDRGIDPQRHVVDEEAVVDRSEVDPSLHRVAIGIHRGPGVVAVEAEIEGEVVAGARRDAHEREAVLDSNRGHQRLRAVATGHAEAIGSAGDGIASELLEVEPPGQHHRLDAKLGREVEETEPLDLASPRPGITQQHGPQGTTGSSQSSRRVTRDRAAERMLGEADRRGKDRQDQDGAPRNVNRAAGGDAEADGDEDDAAEREHARHHAQDPGLGHQPPRRASEHRHTDEAEHKSRPPVAHQNCQHDGHSETEQRHGHQRS
jgi:hypothetical protein